MSEEQGTPAVLPASIKSITFLKAWCKATDTYPVLTAIHTDAGTGEKGKIESCAFPRTDVANSATTDWGACMRWIEARQGKANLYFNVNPRVAGTETRIKVKLTEVAALVALHVDVDVRVGEDQVQGIARIVKTFEAYKHPPTFITSSGGGAQAFWVLKDSVPMDGTEDMARNVAGYNRAVERDLDGDHCHNLDRIMRLPGTINVPNKVKLAKGRKPALAAVLVAEPDRLYNIGDFDNMPAQPVSTASVTKATATGGEGQGTPKKGKTESDPLEGHVYENVPNVNDDKPILSLEDPRLNSMDKWCKEFVRTKTIPPEAPADIQAKAGNNGWWDFKIACELVRIGITDNGIKQTWKAGKIGADASEWPRGFDGDMDRLIERAREASKDPDIEEFNLNHFVINIAGKWRIGTMQESKLYEGQRELVIATVDDFKFGYRRRFKVIMVKIRDEDGNDTGELKPRKVNLVDYWLKHPQCRQYDHGFIFAPQSDTKTYKGALNMWQGFAFDAIAGDWSLFKKHMLDNICNGNVVYYDYLIRWMAWVVQNKKASGVAIALRSQEEGTGKGIFATVYGRIWGPHFMQLTNAEHIFGKFNPHIQNLVVINADEAMFAGDPRQRNALWSMVTEPWLTIEPKGFSAYKAVNHTNYIITTNQELMVKVTRTVRRMFALDVATHQMQNRPYFQAILQQMDDGGYAGMLHELVHMDLKGFDVGNCPKTKALDKQKALSRTGVDAIVEKACHEAVPPCPHYRFPGYTVTAGNEQRQGFDFFVEHHPDKDLARMGSVQVKRRLRDDWKCITGQPAQRRDSASETGRIAGVLWPKLADLRAAFVALHGEQDWLNTGATEWLVPSGESAAPPGTGPTPKKEGMPEIPF